MIIKKRKEILRSFNTLKSKIEDNRKEILKKSPFLNKNLDKKIKPLFKTINPTKWVQTLQDKLEQSVSNNTEDVVLKQAPYWAKAITWTLMGGSVFAFSWLCIARTEEIVIATGKLEPISGVVDVQMPLEGIASQILVKEGKRVYKGDTLIELDTESTEARRLATVKSLAINQEILKRLQILSEEGAVPELQYLQQKNKIAELESKLKESDVILRYQKIIAPIDGMVFDLKPKTPGFVARTSEPVLKIVPLDKLKAKVEINSRSIGFVSVGKKADISIDSFPSSDFGVITGEVTKIGSDALPPNPSQNKGYRFPADINLDSQELILSNGNKLDLQVGMSLTANIKLRKVTYLQLLLSNFKDKAQSLQEI